MIMTQLLQKIQIHYILFYNMGRSKYINTFDTTADYNNYIESALPEFPNVGYDKQAGEVKITRTSPNSHVIYGELNDNTIQPLFRLINFVTITKQYNLTVDQLNNTYYLDDWGTLPTFNTFNEYTFFHGLKDKVTSLKKLSLDTSSVTNMNHMFEGCSYLTSVDLSSLNTSNVTNMSNMFWGCSSLTSLDLSNLDTSNVTNVSQMFYNCRSLTSINLNNCDFSNVTNMTNMFSSSMPQHDIYINVEATLMKLTDNLNGGVLKITATIHYDNGSQIIDYKWQNNAWTPQS